LAGVFDGVIAEAYDVRVSSMIAGGLWPPVGERSVIADD
jgi:hypothetical protein